MRPVWQLDCHWQISLQTYVYFNSTATGISSQKTRGAQAFGNFHRGKLCSTTCGYMWRMPTSACMGWSMQTVCQRKSPLRLFAVILYSKPCWSDFVITIINTLNLLGHFTALASANLRKHGQ
jgi:hypothetical protein